MVHGVLLSRKPCGTSELAVSRIHPSRDGKSHDCQDGGADSSWAYHGAYYYSVQWLISYYLHANTNTNSTYKTWAAQNANSRIGSKFCAGDVPASVKTWAGASAGSSFNGTVMDL